MVTHLSSVSDVIAALGGNPEIAKLCEVGVTAVSNWRTSNQFPAHTFPIIHRELAARGFSADVGLWRFGRKTSERKQTQNEGASA